MNVDKFVEFLKSEKRYSPHTILAYTADIAQFEECSKRECGVADENDVTAPMIRIWLVELKERGVSNRSIGRKVASLRTYFNFLDRAGLIENNPMLKIVAPKVTRKNPTVVLTDEMERVLAEKQQDTSFIGVRDSLILELLYATGMRQAEMLEVEEGDIYYVAQEIRRQGKGRKEYIERKHALNSKTPKLFVNRRYEPMSKKQLYTMVCKEMEAITSSVQHSPHVLRHSFATNTLSEGADISSIKEMLGHSSLAATQVYTHTTIEELKKAYKLAHPRADEGYETPKEAIEKK